MANKTEGILTLVREVLQTIPKPYGEDIIEDVFLKIEANSVLLQRYNSLVTELTKDVVNQWIGQYTRQLTGMKRRKQVPAKRSKLTGSYTKLRA